MIHLIRTSFILASCTLTLSVHAQQITGIWSGKINKKRAEIKFVQKGDSITGTSYYYESGKNYLRYSIKGYFDPNNNSVVWWDDQLLWDEGRSAKEVALLSVADFNCLILFKRYAKDGFEVIYSLRLRVFNEEDAANYLVKLLFKNSNFAETNGNGTP
jgi:hypothetical protein